MWPFDKKNETPVQHIEQFAEIQQQFDEVISHSQCIDNVQSDLMLSMWETAKKPFYSKMGGLIYEYPTPVCFEMDIDAKTSRLESFLNTIAEKGIFCEIIANFLAANSDGFFENKTVVDWEESRGNYSFSIPRGMRIGKALKKTFCDYVNEDILEDIRNEMSRIIQENKVTGTLCLSVHPLDYLSSSENNHNWRSCHALDGDYRAGNLSYMVDNCTIIAYLKSTGEDVKLPRFPQSVKWNDKKWRCLLFFDRENKLIYSGRQYPFASNSAFEHLSRALIALNFFDDNPVCADKWRPSVFTSAVINNVEWRSDSRYITLFDGGIMPLDDLITDHSESYHFNDLMRSSFYLPHVYDYGYYFYGDSRYKTRMVVGGPTYCLKCGKAHLLQDSNTMMCPNCAEGYGEEEEVEYCGLCGSRIRVDDELYTMLANGMIYCEDCTDNADLRECSYCGQLVDIDNPTDDSIKVDENGCLCAYCATRR